MAEVVFDHPLWERLKAVEKVVAERSPGPLSGLDSVGLILVRGLPQWDYWCTPKNVLTFATTGGNGVHFNFLIQNDSVGEHSPIVITIPNNFDQPNYIVGESLFDFLCLGYHRGYFALEQLPWERLFEAYASSDWQPSDETDEWVGFGVNVEQRRVLELLIAEFGLSPWKDLQHKFEDLQARYCICCNFAAVMNIDSAHFERGPYAAGCTRCSMHVR